MIRPFLVLAPLLLFAACAGAPAPAPAPAPAATPAAAFDPVGTFDFSTSVEGQVITGVIRVSRGTTGDLSGMISTSATPEMPVQSVTTEGNRMTLRTNTPDGSMSMILEFRGTDFTGSWGLAGMSGTLTGRRRS
jgi:hypothetical protein